ncbi:hypothetical protein GCM10023318_58940 [Nocardia callitridis]|uniref:Uncharacterized protein n=1 Tax=Nocardia callitridis TaxID=648753 RepID=A0ABP9L376_9NOCA
MDIRTVMVTGANPRTAAAIAAEGPEWRTGYLAQRKVERWSRDS